MTGEDGSNADEEVKSKTTTSSQQNEKERITYGKLICY